MKTFLAITNVVLPSQTAMEKGKQGEKQIRCGNLLTKLEVCKEKSRIYRVYSVNPCHRLQLGVVTHKTHVSAKTVEEK